MRVSLLSGLADVYRWDLIIDMKIMTKKKLKGISAALCMALLLSGCNDAEESSSLPTELVVSAAGTEETVVSAFPVEVCGAEITQSVSSCISLSPAVTEILFELGFGDKLIGVSSYCDFPEGISAKAYGSSENPDIDGIIAAAPQAVFTLSQLSERECYALDSAGIAVIMLTPPVSLEGYSQLYRDIAAAFYGREYTDSEKQTEKAIQCASAARTALEKKSVPLGSFVYVTGKLTLAGSGTFENAVLSLCGENLCTAEGYVPTEIAEGASAQYIIADNTLTESELKKNDVIAAMINSGAEVLYVSAYCFERPTARTADVFAEITAQLSATAETE